MPMSSQASRSTEFGNVADQLRGVLDIHHPVLRGHQANLGQVRVRECGFAAAGGADVQDRSLVLHCIAQDIRVGFTFDSDEKVLRGCRYVERVRGVGQNSLLFVIREPQPAGALHAQGEDRAPRHREE